MRKFVAGTLFLIASFSFVGAATQAGATEKPKEDKKVFICHHDNGKPEWKVIEISYNALDSHLGHQWGADIYPVPENGCPVTEDEETTTTTTEPEQTTTTTVEETTTTTTVVDETTTTTTDPGTTTTSVEVGEPPVPTTEPTVAVGEPPVLPTTNPGVAIAPAVAAPNGTGSLPQTGGGTTLALIGAGALIGGTVLLVVSRRRKTIIA